MAGFSWPYKLEVTKTTSLGMILQGMACLVKEKPHIDFCQKPSFFRCQAHLTRPSTFASSTIDAGLHFFVIFQMLHTWVIGL